MSLEQVFSSSELSVVVPDTSLEFPPETSIDEWLGRVKIGKVERKQVFFDEQLQSLLLLRVPHPTTTPDAVPPDPKNPPLLLLEFLNYLQVSLEASYISQVPTALSQVDVSRSSRLSAPPRSSSLARSAQLGVGVHHPSIFPPSTPNPLPSTGENDRQYASSEGALLAAIIWGTNTAEERESFALLWSEKEKVWVAVYSMVLTVSFIKTVNTPNPLLCLTVSTTLREKPIITSEKHPLAKFLSTFGVAPEAPIIYNDGNSDQPTETLLDGLEEVNLLEGLLAGPAFANMGPEELNFPSLRLGPVSREKLFSLPPVLVDTPLAPSPSPMTAIRRAHPTLRKSYRRTLQAVSPFELRMRTVFVPFVLLPQTEGAVPDLDKVDKERERREAGSAERTVVLCIEIKNTGENPEFRSGIGFLVESINIRIAGDGAKTTLIGWGEAGLTADASKTTFPLRLGPLAQVNLLYAVTFLRSPEELDGFSFAKPGVRPKSELRRGVSLNVNGRPYLPLTPSARAHLTEPDAITYPTRTFSSVWSTVLDLDANPAPVVDAYDPSDPLGGYPSILPEPPSPFPMFAPGSSRLGTPLTAIASGYTYSPDTTPQSSAFPGLRKFPLTPGGYFQSKFNKNLNLNLTPNRPSQLLSMYNPSPLNSGRSSSYTPGSSALGTMQYLRSPTTYSAPPPLPPPPPHSPSVYPFSPDYDEASLAGMPSYDNIPPTPAYPAFPPKSTLPPSPVSQGPIASQSQNNVGPSVEVRRDRPQSAPVLPGMPPPTPVPHVSAAFGEQRMLAKLQNSAASGDSIVVSIGLLPLVGQDAVDKSRKRRSAGGEVILGPEKIYPLDVFTLDIFVFNQSTWTRRFEVTCPERRRRRRGGAQTGVYGGGGEVARKMGYPGVLPMDKRVRIGPLRPSSCQSVRMDFLAVSPGVHSIDTLTLLDIETGFSMNLRAVLDIVVHDPND